MTKNFVIYRSSAGSGKTYTLVKEYLKLALQYPSSNYYRHILAITFTNKAAGEMKHRILSQLTTFGKAKKDGVYRMDLLADNDSDLVKTMVKEMNEGNPYPIKPETLLERADKTLSHILHNYSDLSISTIDSFVHGIIRSFARDINLDLEFEVSLDSTGVLKKTIDNLLGEVGKDEDLTSLVLQFVESKIEDSKAWNIQDDLEKFGKNILKDSAKKEITKLKSLSVKDFKQINKKLNQKIKDFEDSLAEICQKVDGLVTKSGLINKNFSRSLIPNFFIKIIEQKLGYETPTDTVISMMTGEKEWYAKSQTDEVKLIIEGLKPQISKLYEEVMELMGGPEMNKYGLRKAIRKTIYSNSLLSRIDDFANVWKEDNNTLLVADFNQLISRIILDNPAPFIYEKIGERYHHLLIDEFQDTSVMQWQNFLPLIENSLAKGKFNMLVGDGKQAIYRWRDGEVMQFANLPNIYQPITPAIASIERVLKANFHDDNLDTNYRSSKEIIEFNNKLYNNLSNHLVGTQKIYEGASQLVGKDIEGLVTVDSYSAKLTEERFELIFNQIVKQIIEALADGFDQKDIAILCRKNKLGKAIAENILDQERINAAIEEQSLDYSDDVRLIIESGLNVITSDSLLLQNNPRVMCLVSLAKITVDPRDEKSKIDLLTNIGKLSLIDMTFHDLINKYIVVNKDGKYSRKEIDIEQFLSDYFDQYQLTSYLTQGIYEVMEAFVRLFGFHTEADNYLEYFLQSIMQDPAMTIVDFVHWWNDNESKLGVGEAEGSDGIRIMSIHKSKGLQFPIVIFPFDVEKNRPTGVWISSGDEEIGLPTALVDITISEKNHKFSPEIESENNMQLLDLFNTLYVATTRPEIRLHFIIGLPDNPKFEDSKYPFQYLNNAFELMWPDYNSEDFSYQIGQRIKKKKKEIQNDSNNIITLENFLSSPISDGVKLCFGSQEKWGESDDRDYGILVHQVLSEIVSLTDLSTNLTSKLSEGIISNTLLKKLTDELTSFLEDKNVKQWFDPKAYLSVKSEKDLLTAQGSILRPDKVIYFKDRVDVVDFKTGSPHRSHYDQVEEYVRNIQKTTTMKVHGYLVYTKTHEVVSVENRNLQLDFF